MPDRNQRYYPVKGKTYYAKWKVIPVAATMDVTTSKSDYLVNTPVDVNIAIAPVLICTRFSMAVLL